MVQSFYSGHHECVECKATQCPQETYCYDGTGTIDVTYNCNTKTAVG